MIDSNRHQSTISQAAGVEGFGYWSGRDVRLEFRPAEVNSGIVFVRSDLGGLPRIPATLANRAETPLRTTLQCGGATVEMIEHVMAALVGLEIDNCEVWTDQPEMPGCDGSALPLVEALETAGIVRQEAPRPRLVLRDVIRLGSDTCWIEARPTSSKTTMLDYQVDYGPGSPIGCQRFRLSLSPETFRRELASSRTFLLQSEAEQLLAQGLGRRTSFKDLLVFGPDGPIDNKLRFPDECVRHKLLDMVGDLGLLGCRLVASVTASRSGHRLNGGLVQALLADGPIAEQPRRCA